MAKGSFIYYQDKTQLGLKYRRRYWDEAVNGGPVLGTVTTCQHKHCKRSNRSSLELIDLVCHYKRQPMVKLNSMKMKVPLDLIFFNII